MKNESLEFDGGMHAAVVFSKLLTFGKNWSLNPAFLGPFSSCGAAAAAAAANVGNPH